MRGALAPLAAVALLLAAPARAAEEPVRAGAEPSLDEAVDAAAEGAARAAGRTLEQGTLSLPEPGEFPPPGAPVVVRVAVRAPPGVDAAEWEPLVGVKAGDRLSRRAVRRTLQRLFELGRFANVAAETAPAGEGVLLTFVLEPRRQVAAVEVEGASRLARDRLDRITGIRAGDEFTEDRVTAAIAGLRDAYARLGFEAAAVRSEVAYGQGVTVRLAVDEGPATTVASLVLAGDPGPPALARRAVATGPGVRFDQERLENELEELRAAYRAAGHYRARVGAPSVERVEGRRVRIVVPVRAGPAIDFRFRGGRAFGAARLREALAYEGEELLDREMIGELAGRIERTYRREGWLDAKVIPVETLAPDRTRATVAFHVQEGRRLVVRQVSFEGNARIDDDELLALAGEVLGAALGGERVIGPPDPGELGAVGLSGRSRTRPAFARRAEPLEVYDPEAYAQVTAAILARYRDEGFLDAVVAPAVVEIDEANRLATVRIPIREGRQVRLRAVEFPGATSIPKKALAALGPRAGSPVSERRVEEWRLAIRARYEREGWLYVAVESRIERPGDDPTSATVRFEVREGPQVQVGRIVVQGNRRTRESVVRETLLVGEGETLGSEGLAGSQQALMRTGLFRTVAVRPIDPDLPEAKKDLVVDLRERPVRSVEVGGGVSIADGPRSFAEFTERNIFGRNLEFGARGKVNYQLFRPEVTERPLGEAVEREVDLGLRTPRLHGLPVPLGARIDFVHERDIRPAYDLTKWAGIVGVDWRGGPFGASLGYEIESNAITRSAELEDLYGRLTKEDLDQLRFPEGETLLGSLRPALILDLRDDPTAPHRGFWAKVQTDYARSLGRHELSVDFLKLSATGTGYVPLGRRTTLVLSASGGKVFPLDDASTTIAPKRFYLGGAGSIRGFPEDGVVPEDRRAALRDEIAACESLVYRAGCSNASRYLQAGREVPSEGGEVFLLVRTELRFPILGDLMGGLFVDAGNLWADPDAFDPVRLRSAAGFGLRYATPVGPVALDLGFNLRPDELLHESPFALHFSIGLF